MKEIIVRRMKTEEYSLLKEFTYLAIYVPHGVKTPPKSIVSLHQLEKVMNVLQEDKTELLKEKASLAATLLQEEAKKQGISLSLRKNTERR